MKNLIFTIAAFLLFASAAFAQGAIEGKITDAKGNGVANVTITVVGANGKPVATVKTDADGGYSFENLAAGKYKIAAYGAPGFDSAFREDVVVEDDDTATVDMTLAADSPNGGKTQTKTDWPTVKFAFEVEYNVGGKTYKFIAAEVTGLSAEAQPIEYKPWESKEYSTQKMPGIKKFGDITIKKVHFKDDIFKDDTGFWNVTGTGGTGAPRGTITIRLLDERAGTAMSWRLTNAFISKLVGKGAEIESMTIAHEGLALVK